MGDMTEYIYGDVLFIINFSMDFISLFICGKLMHFRMNAWRMALASTMGGIYGVASLFFSSGAFGDMMLDTLVALSMCFVAHYHGSAGKTSAVTALFGGVSMLMGGAMTALYSKIGKYQSYISIGGSVSTVFGDMPVCVFAVLAAVSAFLTFFLQKSMRKHSQAKTCRIKITLEDGEYEFSAFVDSGNCAEEPISGKAVVFLSRNASERIRGESGKLLFLSLESELCENAGKVRFVPVNTVSGYTLVSALIPVKFEVDTGKGFSERSALIARDANSCGYGGAEALLPSAIL